MYICKYVYMYICIYVYIYMKEASTLSLSQQVEVVEL